MAKLNVEQWKHQGHCYEVKLELQAEDLENEGPQSIVALDVQKPNGTFARFWLAVGLNHQGQATADITARCGKKDVRRKVRALWNKPQKPLAS
jgi:hypothetical protein